MALPVGLRRGVTLEAAKAVSAGAGPDAAEMLDRLTSLMDKSLVTVDAQEGEARYRLLETIRQYDRKKPGRSGEATVVRRKHLDMAQRRRCERPSAPHC